MRFEVETVYDRPTIQAFQRILNRTIRRRRIRAVRAIALITGGVSLIYGLLWLWVGVTAGVSLVPALSGIGAGVVFLLLGLFYERYIGRSGRHMVNQTPTVIRYRFDDRGYTTETGGKTTRSTYGIVGMFCGDTGYYVVMLDRRRGFVLDKSRFLSGDAEEFRAFLEERAGKPYQRAE